MRAWLLVPPLLLAACNPTDDTSGASGDEAARLNAAAETLDINATQRDATNKE